MTTRLLAAHLAALAAGLALSLAAHAQKPAAFRPFVASEYDSNYKVTQAEITHGAATIRIVQVKRNSRQASFNCRAWLSVEAGGGARLQRYFHEIHGVGSWYGLFVPKAQPPAPFFAVAKLGDYKGELFLVREDGATFELRGGRYLLSDDRRLLYSDYDSDESRIVVFDIAESRPVFESGELPSIHHWYRWRGGYAFSESEWLKVNQGNASEKPGKLWRYDAAARKLVEDTADLSAARRASYAFEPKGYANCVTALDRPK